MRFLSVALVLAPLSLACSFDATGTGPGVVSDPGSTGGAATSGGDETSTSGGPDAPTTSTLPPETTTVTSEPVDPDTTASSGDADSSGGESSSGPPPPPGCGDGTVDDGEACDDGNDVDGDECTNQCTLAVCGDGVVGPGEACDDGNMTESDGCTSQCAVPACDDEAMNGAETDVDCGGGLCKPCEVQQTCGTGTDCTTGFCDGTCVHAPSCRALKMLGQSSGKATIDPDGGGEGEPFEVWCEQDMNGGGWTLVLKLDGSKNSFVYADAKWGDPGAWNPDPDLDRTETKLQSYSTVAVDEVLLGMEAPIGMNGALALQYIQFNPDPNPASLHAVFSSGMYLATDNPESEWTGLVAGSGLQDNCKRQGFNTQATSNPGGNARVRLGMLGNNENNCGSTNSFIGIGASPEGDACDGGYNATTGNGAVCFVDGGKRDIAAFAVVYVR